MPQRRVRAVFYGINGTGLGHLSRLLAIAREARHLLHALGHGADFRFLTTSEAPQAAWDFPTWKLPSKTVAAGADLDSREYLAMSQFLVTNLVAVSRPDLLVMDTLPQGSFGEFLQLRSFSRKTVFVNRHKDEAHARDALHQSHLSLYDLLLTPDAAEAADRYVIPPELAGRNVFTGTIHGFRQEEALSPAEVRARFGVQPHQTLVYVSAGGGGDRQAEAELTALLGELARDPSVFTLVGYGPLYRGAQRHAPGVVPLTDPDARRLFAGVELAFSAAGYNSYEELLAAGVPTAFFAQHKGLDRQDERVALGAGRGWHLHLADFHPLTIRETLDRLRDPAVRAGIAAALARRGRNPGALAAAVELLRLHAGLAGSPVDETALFAAAALRAAWPGAVRELGPSPAEPRPPFAAAARWTLAWQRLAPPGPARNRFFDGARAAATAEGHAPLTAALVAGAAIEGLRVELGLSERHLESLLRHFAAASPRDAELDSSLSAAFAGFCRARLHQSPSAP